MTHCHVSDTCPVGRCLLGACGLQRLEPADLLDCSNWRLPALQWRCIHPPAVQHIPHTCLHRWCTLCRHHSLLIPPLMHAHSIWFHLLQLTAVPRLQHQLAAQQQPMSAPSKCSPTSSLTSLSSCQHLAQITGVARRGRHLLSVQLTTSQPAHAHRCFKTDGVRPPAAAAAVVAALGGLLGGLGGLCIADGIVLEFEHVAPNDALHQRRQRLQGWHQHDVAAACRSARQTEDGTKACRSVSTPAGGQSPGQRQSSSNRTQTPAGHTMLQCLLWCVCSAHPGTPGMLVTSCHSAHHPPTVSCHTCGCLMHYHGVTRSPQGATHTGTPASLQPLQTPRPFPPEPPPTLAKGASTSGTS